MFSTTAIAESAPVLGSVTKIDQKQGKITLKHGPIKNLEMDAMTMVFAVGDPTMLKTVKVGDKVVTTGGIYGKITRVNERTLQIEIADRVRIEVARASIGGYQGQEPVVSESANA